MLDIHSHILFGVDDGSETFAESLEMLRAAVDVGIDQIYATPHWKSMNGDLGAIHRAFERLLPEAEKCGVALRLGFEYNINAIDITDFSAAKAFALEQSDSLLLEFPFGYWPREWEQIILRLQRTGLRIIIAHPERYVPLQKDLGILDELIDIGCLLQCNASSILSIRPDKQRVVRYIRRLGRLDFLATDAHSARDYALYARALRQVGTEIRYPNF